MIIIKRVDKYFYGIISESVEVLRNNDVRNATETDL